MADVVRFYGKTFTPKLIAKKTFFSDNFNK